MIRVLSLGAGVQSTTVALMAIEGAIPPIEHAIFADTGWEPAEVYAHLDRLTPALEAAGVQVHVVAKDNLREAQLHPTPDQLIKKNQDGKVGLHHVRIPVFTKSSDIVARRDLATDGMMNRQCTERYKVEPVHKKLRELLGLNPRQRWPLDPSVELVFGISWDEVQRMKSSRRAAIVNSYPLVDLRVTRADCHTWMAARGWSAPRSACIGCPFHSDEEWRQIRERPDEWADAVEFDRGLRDLQREGKLLITGEPFLHRSGVPLDEADIDDPYENQLSLFDEECGGFCGT